MVFDVAHCGASGVKIYAALVLLSILAGAQVPVIPFGEVDDKVELWFRNRLINP